MIEADFALFGVSHVSSLAVCGAVAIAGREAGVRLRRRGKERPLAIALALGLAVVESLRTWQAVYVDGL